MKKIVKKGIAITLAAIVSFEVIPVHLLPFYFRSYAKTSEEVFVDVEINKLEMEEEFYDKSSSTRSPLSEKILLGEKSYQEAFLLPELTGNWREDIIAVAESQLGYEEAVDGSTLFGAWAGDAKQAWCSEFTSWCAYQVGIPETIFPKKRSSRAFHKYYSEIGRFYFLEGGIGPKVSGYGSSHAEMISLEELKPGDIILKETNGDYSNGADHTGLFVGIKNGEILYISGNSNDSVEEKICPIETIHGICKPDYDGEHDKPEQPSNNNLPNEESSSSSHSNDRESSSFQPVYQVGIQSSVLGKKFWKTNGIAAKNEWIQDQNIWYYAGADGLLKVGWLQLSGKWYYLLESCAMATDWQFVNGRWYYLDTVNGDMKTDWQWINGKWYYFDPANGDMKTGWIHWNNHWYYLNVKNGDCLMNTVTPDGYIVDENGAWIP